MTRNDTFGIPNDSSGSWLDIFDGAVTLPLDYSYMDDTHGDA